MQIGATVRKLGPSAQAARPDLCSLGEILESTITMRDKSISGRPTNWHRSQACPRCRFSRQILQAMDGNVGPVVEQGLLDRFGEDAEAPHGREGGRLVTVAMSLDQDQFHGPFANDRPKEGGYVVGLPECEGTATSPKSEGSHPGIVWERNGKAHGG